MSKEAELLRISERESQFGSDSGHFSIVVANQEKHESTGEKHYPVFSFNVTSALLPDNKFALKALIAA